MKKIVLSLAVIASVALVSCNNTNTQQNAETTTPTTEQATAPEAVQAPAFAYSVNPTSVVEWVGSKPAGKHNGTVNVTTGGVNVENGAITKAKEDLEAHLKGTDPEKVDHFFNVKDFPTASFVFKKFDGKNLTGDLTIKGKTKEVSFPATVTVTDNEVSIVSQPFKINRVDFGVNYGSKSVFDDLKDKFINDDVELVVKAKATK